MIKKANIINISNIFFLAPLYIVAIFIFFYIIYIWSWYIIDFIIALLFAFAIISLSNFYQQFKISSFFSLILSISTYIGFFLIIWTKVWGNISILIDELPIYQEEIKHIINNIFHYFNMSPPDSFDNLMSKIDLQKLFESAFEKVRSIFSSAWVILFYLVFILLEYRYFKLKLNLIITDKKKRNQLFNLLDIIKKDIKSYFIIKVYISIITWVSSYIVLLIFGLPFADFFAFSIFILNFIPNIWSFIAVLWTILFSILSPNFNIYDIVLMGLLLVWIQTFIDSIIEPKFMGNKLNLSPLAIVLWLWFWYLIWWILGMFLAVPIMVIMNIVFSKIPETRFISILLSEKWDIYTDGSDGSNIK